MSGDALEVRNPASGAVVGTVAISSADDVIAKAQALRAAQPAWEALGPSGRKKWLLRLQDWVVDHADELADAIQSESAKTRIDARVEVLFTVDQLGYWARNASKFLADQHPAPHSPLMRVKRLTTVYKPYQLVGVITPWNFPLAMGVADMVPALAAGAAVLHKPSEVTPLTPLVLERGWAEIGAPPVFAVVSGSAETGAALIDNTDYVQFTGSSPTGRKIGVACAERMTPYSLELGGKDPAIVLADADLDRAAYGIAYGALVNTGQLCISIERVYVEAPVYDKFVAKLVAHVGELRQGHDDRSNSFDLGPLANQAQLAIVTRHVEEALAAGATALTGGKPSGTGTFFPPTVLIDVDHTMSCITEETFGPTIPVMKVADEAEAIRLANDSIFGLSASVWTGSRSRGRRIAAQLTVGAVNINDSVINLFNPTVPHGGWGKSGTGYRWGGANGLRKYCRQQAITEPSLPTQMKEMLWFPYSPKKFAFMEWAMRAVSARGRRRFGPR
ncbi:aldehyde dehydrogenase family protein [Aldersonia sp. NBC_00410]|uniref:aldehyde dehydrogenase family protein n=1 Tax=Aldersonia sp. NBC_00410 TaxID=2975954 RepID=UPI00225B0025|nr:aldehyde dehydrogenase family protein [Aldersonia sp. NBC_00410]MCX5045113.1 aldehyde dehydrogenase family protein [Aldersonia sp. NBC_00410]